MGKGQERRSRHSLLLDHDSELINIKPPSSHESILYWLGECGYYRLGMSGPTQITWADINHWSFGSETDITREEKLLMRELSSIYCNQYHKSSDRNEPCPVAVYVENKASLGNRIKSVIRSKKPS